MEFGIFSVADHHPEFDRTPHQLYAELLEQAEHAERLGYESYWVAEHHFHHYGIVPAPAVLLSAIAQRTQTLRVGTGVVVCPFHNPIEVAEQYAMLDMLSGGRLNFGTGSGYLAHEYSGFNVDPQQKRERFDEALDIVLRAWRGETIDIQSPYHTINQVAINVQPVQQPHPPTWIAVIRPEAALFVARKGFPLLGVPYTSGHIETARDMIQAYHQAYGEAGFDPAQADVTLVWHTYVADTTDKAIREARDALQQYTDTRLFATSKGQLFDDLYDRGLLIIGDPAYCRERIAELQDWGMTRMLTLSNFGALAHDKVGRSMQLFAKEIMPAFAGRGISVA